MHKSAIGTEAFGVLALASATPIPATEALVAARSAAAMQIRTRVISSSYRSRDELQPTYVVLMVNPPERHICTDFAKLRSWCVV